MTEMKLSPAMKQTRHVGFTGTRRGMTAKQLAKLKEILPSGYWFHHGDCVGADMEAHAVALRKGCGIEIHPCTLTNQRAYCQLYDQRHAPKPPLERNRDIVDAVDWMIAAPATKQEVVRSGTWATIRYARRVGKMLTILEP